MSAIAPLTADALKSSVIPGIFADSILISEYGTSGVSSSDAMGAFQSIMEASPIGRLADHISKIVGKLVDADPKKIAAEPSWLDKLLGRDVEQLVRYEMARESLDELLDLANKAAVSVKETVKGLERLLSSHHTEVDQLDAYIQAGHEYLSENPLAGMPSQGALEFDKPRERFARKLTNLAAIRASHEMSAAQMRLARSTALDLLDRFSETTTVLLPVWRHHAMAMANAKGLDPEIVSQATQAHQALLRSLQGLEEAHTK